MFFGRGLLWFLLVLATKAKFEQLEHFADHVFDALGFILPKVRFSVIRSMCSCQLIQGWMAFVHLLLYALWKTGIQMHI
jgi:hypothetical protein